MTTRFIPHTSLRKSAALLLATFLGLGANLANATTLISPTGDGGFENGVDFPTNGWTVVNGSNNRLFVGSAPVASAGTNCAFSGTNSTTWTGEAFSNVNHFYRDIAFPAGESSITLTFKYKINSTDPTFDYLKLFLVPTTTTPVAGTQLSSGQIGVTTGYDSATTYTLTTVSVPASAAGTTQRLVFSWRSDGVSPNAAVAVDEISLTSVAPVPISGTKTIGTGGDFTTLTAAITYLNANGVNGALFLELLPTYTSGSESFPLTFGNIPGNSGVNTITVRPQTGASGLVITTSNSTATIDLNGAQNVIFDGRPGGTGTAKQLTLANTSTTSPGAAVRFINDAISNKLTFCTLTGVVTSTTSGVVLFSTTTGANGNDNNTVDTCDITAGATTPTNCIYSSGTTTTTTTNNSGNVITNSNISNWFSATSTSVGILLSSGTTDWTISNNKFFQTATRTQTSTSLSHSAIQIANSTSGNNFQITGNTIGFASSTGTGTYTFVLPSSTSGGFIPVNLSVGTTTATSIQNNTIAGIAVSGSASGTSSSAPFRGIYVSSGLVNIGNVAGNTIGSMSATGSITYTSSSSSTSDVIGMFNFGSSNWTTNNNNIGGITASNSSTGATNVYGIRVNTGSTATFTCQNNTIGGTVANSIQSTSTATGTIVNGILNANPIGTITGNTIRNLTAAGGTGTGSSASVAGIVSTASSANHTVSQNTIHTLTNSNVTAAATVTGIQYTSSTGTNVIARNFIHSFSSPSTAATLNGINVAGGTTTYKNNMIRLGVDAAGNSVTTACAINGINEPVSTGTDNFFNNSVFIGGTGVGTTASNTFAFNSLTTTVTRLFQDNIFVNARSNATTGGKHYAVQVGGTAANPAGLTINYNVYNVTGTGGVFGRFNSADVATLAAWKTAVGQDGNSFGSDPMFLTPNGTSSTVDLHINPSVTTVVEGNGLLIASVTDDFDGDNRASFTPTDIGADAGNFTGTDLAPPNFSYTPLANTTSTSARTLTATITDATGVPTSGIGLPVLYWKINTGSYNAATGSFIGSSQYQFTFGGGANVNDTVSYYIVAEDTASPANVGASPSGAGNFTADPPAAGTPPTNPNSYLIQPSISGSFTVGAGGNYATIGAAVNDLNTKVLTGPVTMNLTDATYAGETLPITINANSGSSASNTITIKPSTTSTVTGSSTSSIFKLNGADYVIIDGSNSGGTDRSLTITNTNTGTSGNAVIWVASASASDGATNNTVKNCIITGNASTTTQMGIYSGGASIGTATPAAANNSNNIYRNNQVSKAQFGIFVNGVSTSSLDSGLQIIGNNVGTATGGFSTNGIWVQFQTGASIQQNVVQNVVGTGALADVSGSSTVLTGIDFRQSRLSTLNGNFVFNITYNGTSTFRQHAISIESPFFNTVGTPSQNLISNNVVYGNNYAGAGSTWTVSGINLNGGYGDAINYNSVYMSGIINTTGGPAAAFSNGNASTSVASTNLDIRDNVFQIAGGTGTSSSAPLYAHYTVATSYSGSTVNYNDLYATNTVTPANAFVGLISSTGQTTLAGWKTATGQEANSQSADPLFNSTTNLQPQLGSPVLAAGTPLSAVTVDITGASRSGATPSEGAYENASDSAPPTITYAPLGNTTSTTSRTLTATITDASGVPTSGVGLPVLYWKINTGSYTSAPGSFIGSNQYQFTFGSGVNTGDTVSYYVVAQDGASPPNVIANPSTGAGGYTANPPAAGTPPTTPNSYTIQQSISGSFNVGAGGNYATITLAIADINNKVMTGPVTLNLTDATYASETFPIMINVNGGSSATNTLTIKPTGTTTISGSSISSIFKLNGADFVIIDGSNSGGTDRSLTITNTNTGSATAAVWLASLGTGQGATNDVIKNCNISAGNSTGTASYGVAVAGGTIGTSGADNDNDTIQNNVITGATIGVYAIGTASTTSGGLDSLSVIGNSVTTNSTIGSLGIQVGNALTSLVSQNTVSVTTSASSAPVGISLETGFVSSTVSGNKITTVLATNTGGYAGRGITIGTGTATSADTLLNNMVAGVNGSNWSSFDDSSSIGIAVGIVGSSTTLTTTTGGVNLYYNSVNMTGSMGSGSSSAITTALYIGSGASALNVRNNVLVNTQVATSTTQKNYAIYSAAANTAFTTIDFNDYFVSDTFNAGSAILGNIGAIDRTTLAAIQTGFGGNISSQSGNPQFVSASDLHISTSIATIVESNATPIAGITTDFDGDTRNVTTPDMGADEGNFIAVVANDIQATAFIDPPNGGSKLVSTSFSPQASFTNNGSATQTNVQVRYKIIGPSPATTVVYNQTANIPSLASLATTTITFPSTSIGTTGTYTIDTLSQLAGDQVPANDEITGTMTIDTPLTGNYNVGSGGNFTTLTSAINKLNGVGVSGAVTITLTDASYSTNETFPIVINAVPGASSTNTITIKPAASNVVTVSGSSTTSILKLNGADFVTVDGSNSGGTDRSLTITNTNTGTSSAVVWVASASGTDGATNDTIKNCIITGNAPATTLMGIYSGGATIGTSTPAATNNNGNTYRNNQVSLAQYGIFVNGVSTSSLDTGLQIIGNNVGTSTNALNAAGILVQFQTGASIQQNVIQNVVGTGGILDVAGSQTVLTGMYLRQSRLSTMNGNFISNIDYNDTSTFRQYALDVECPAFSTSGTPSQNLISNNVIYNNFYNGGGSIWTVSGINLNGGYGDGVYYNSVYMFGTINTTGGPAAAFSNGNAANTVASTNVDLRNNSFELAAGSGTSATAPVYGHYTSATVYTGSTLNYNDYFVTDTAAPAEAFVGHFNSADDATLANWKTATGQEANSLSTDPKYNNTADLQPQPGSPLLAAGTPISGVTTDITGATRSATTPAIGAYETGADSAPPTISYTALGNTSSTASRPLSAVVITDATGVNTANLTRPRVWFKKSTEPNQLASANNSSAQGWKFVQATGSGGSPFSFNINYALLFGGSATTGDTIQYFVVAQDTATTPNVGINSGTFSATPASVALTTSGVFPIGGTINSYSILPALSGSKTVGASGADYPTLTAAVAALNGSVLSAPLTLTLLDATYPSETFPIVINSNGGSSSANTVTIKPASNQNVTLSATTTLIKLNGADFVTIDGSNNGSTSRNLTLIDNDTGTSSAAIWIGSASSADGATNNVIKNCIMQGNAPTTTLAGVVGGSGTTIGNPAEGANSTNTIQNNLMTRFQNGIYQNGNATTLSQGWVITGNTIGSNVSSDMMGFRGILFQNAQNFSVTNNVIVGVTTSSTSTATGIMATGTISGGSISGNIVGNISNTNSGGYGAIGIWLSATSTTSNLTVANNAVYDVTGVGYDGSTTAEDNGYGIMIDAGGGYKVFYNSVSLSVEESDGLGIPAAINIDSGVTTTNTIDLRDNIFYTSQALGTPYAIYCSAAATVFSNINFNDYFATAGTLGNFGGVDETTITAWRTATGKDANSISANPLYNSTTNLQPQLGAPELAAGTPIAGVTTDILGVTRSATTPSIGAYENGADTVGPAITYTPLANTSTTGNRTLTATITDPSGVPTTGSGLPVLYWKINTGSYTPATGSFIGSNQYQFSFGAGANSGDTVSYYVAAQDSASPANVSVNPSTGAGGFTTNPPAAGTPPTTPNSYTILGTLSGGKTVGTGGDYATISAAANALNNSVVTGPVTFTLTDATYTSETFPITINANPGSNSTNTVTIKPAASNTVTISGSSTTSIFKLNGASFVTIDGSNSGGTDRSMTITNTSTSSTAAVMWLSTPSASAGATNNVIKNCVISADAATTTGYGIVSGGTTIGSNALAANSNNTFQNNLIKKAQFAINLLGTSTTTLDVGNQVINNTIGTSTAAEGFSASAVQMQYQNGPVISGNDVQNLTNSGTAGSNHYGIGILDSKNAAISRNLVHFTRYTGTSTDKFFGILTQTATFNSSGSPSNNSVTNNMVYDMTSTSTSGYWAESGIDDEGGYGDKFYYNSIYLTGSLSGGSSAIAAAFGNGNNFNGSPATNIDVRDNIFYVNGTSSFTTQFYAHYSAGTTYSGSTLNYNDLKCTAAGSATANIGFFNSTSYTTLSSWQSATGQEANSISGDPLFTATTNLHILNASSPVAHAGTPIAGITTDFDGDTRNATLPYIGADELAPLITTSGTLSAVDTTYGSASASPTSFTVSGTNLPNNLTVTPPAGFEVSTSISSGYGSTVVLTPSSGNVPTTTIYVRLAATTDVGTYSGNIVCTSSPAQPKNVATVSSSVSQKNLTITGLTGDNKVYDRTTAATFSGSPVLNGVANGDSIGLGGTPSAAFINFNVGTGKTINVSGYTLTGTKSFDYTLTQPTLTGDITQKNLTITGLIGNDKVYDGTNAATFSGIAALNGVIAGDTGNVTLGGSPSAAFITFDVGTGITINVSGYTLGGSASGNYSLSQPTLLANITQKALTITGITGNDKVYDRTTAATYSGTPVLSGVVAGDVGNVTLGGTPSAAFTNFNVGTNKTINVTGFTLGGSRAFNYTLTQPTVLTADITQKPLTITGLTGDDKVYDRTTAATFTGTPVLNGVIAGDTGNVTLGGTPTAAFVSFDVGTGITINVSGYTLGGSASGNYSLTQPTLSADITQKALTITGITGNDKVYDRTTAATFSGAPALSGVIGGDTGGVTLGGSPTAAFIDFDAGNGKTINVTGFTLGGGRASNYTLTQPTVLTANITPKPLTITGITADDKVYDRTVSATFTGTPALNGVIAGDSGSVTLGGSPSAVFTDFNVGTNKTVNVTGFTLGGTRASNYTLTQPTVLTADITQAPLSITADSGQFKAKGASDPTLTYQETGLISPDTISGALSRTPGETPGSYTITIGTLTAGPNYNISFTSDVFVIAGPIASDDEATRPNGATSFNIPLASLLSNDTRIGSDGNSHTNNLSVTAVQSGTGNSVSISGSNVVYVPTNPNDTTDKTFTYTLTDGATGATDTGTVTVHTDTNVPTLALSIDDVVSPPFFDGVNTTVTVSFVSVPSQSITIEYSTDLVNWTTGATSVNTGSGSFQVTITAAGDQTAAWTAGMFFRATQ